MKNLAIIPARGGSKRIPRKNIRDFLGKPIIAYSIETAIQSGLFDEVMVSTDSEEIRDVAKSYGAKVPFLRSENSSSDHAVLGDVVDEVLEYYMSRQKFNYICCLLPTVPLISTKNLKKGLDILISDKSIDSVKPVVAFSYPVQRALKMTNGDLEWVYPEYFTTRTQDLPPVYHDAGQFWWMKYENGFNGKRKVGFEISEIEVQDIDNIDDWKIAELKYKFLNNVG
jgi:pseudaminic acid cytidylyltransferase